MPAPPEQLFLDCVLLAVSQNARYVPPHDSNALLYIRPLLFGSGPQLGISPPEEFTFCVYVHPGNDYHGLHPLPALLAEDFDRSAPKGTGAAKVGGNYAPVMRWAAKAQSEGYPILLHLDSKTQSEVEEFSTSAFLGVKTDECNGGTTLVVPDSKNVIDSITSESCLALARSFGWDVEVRKVNFPCH
jgi:branched-chain amino acid aminotransferase